MGGEWTTSRITYLIQRGLRPIAATDATATEDGIVSLGGEEQYAEFIELEDESDV
jgi:hypothetical protein